MFDRVRRTARYAPFSSLMLVTTGSIPFFLIQNRPSSSQQRPKHAAVYHEQQALART
jgi:hypothetical protein